MDKKTIATYSVVHRIGGASRITLHFEDGSITHLVNLSIAEAMYVLHLLRHEKPLVLITEGEISRIATAQAEPIGEEDFG